MSTIASFVDRPLFADGGEQIGKVADVIYRPSNLQPEWLVVKTGRFKAKHLVPVVAVSEQGSSLTVPFAKHDVEAAPKANDAVAPTTVEAIDMYHHYGLELPSDDAI
jgi:uncharacterized protein YrrD